MSKEPYSNIKLSDLNEFICCPLCHGYLNVATTVNECLHTFCRSCILAHIKNNHNECPKCNTIIHERRPLDYIVKDQNKQDIVYKLVPQLYISDVLSGKIDLHDSHGFDTIVKSGLKQKFLYITLKQRNKKSNKINLEPDPMLVAQQTTTTTSTNANGTNTTNTTNAINTTTTTTTSNTTTTTTTSGDNSHEPIYLKCPFTIKGCHLRKLLTMKYQLEEDDRVNIIINKRDSVSDEDQISNLAQALVFDLEYEISRIVRIQDNHTSTTSAAITPPSSTTLSSASSCSSSSSSTRSLSRSPIITSTTSMSSPIPSATSTSIKSSSSALSSSADSSEAEQMSVDGMV